MIKLFNTLLILLEVVYLVEDYSFELFFVILVLKSGKSTSNSHQRSLKILNYWINRNNLELKKPWLASFLRKIRILIIQLDELYKSSPNRVFYRIIEHNQVQMYNLHLFNFIPNLEYLYQGHSKVNRIISLSFINKIYTRIRNVCWFLNFLDLLNRLQVWRQPPMHT